MSQRTAAAPTSGSALRRIAAQTRIELLMTLRRGEAVLITFAIPIGILVFFTGLEVLPHSAARPVDFLTPGVLALSVIASAMVALGIATGFDRQNGVLKRLGVTPLGRSGLLVAKLGSVLVVVTIQSLLVAATGFALGWRPDGSALAAGALVALGVAAFGGIGFALAGVLRAEANLALANALFLLMLLTGGIIVSVDRLPGPLAAVARVLPAEPLATGLRAAFSGDPVDPGGVLVLAIWAMVAAATAAATFRWE